MMEGREERERGTGGRRYVWQCMLILQYRSRNTGTTLLQNCVSEGVGWTETGKSGKKRSHVQKQKGDKGKSGQRARLSGTDWNERLTNGL